jgi:hypothetical protein
MLWPFAPAFNTEDEVRDAALYFSNFPATQQVHIFAAFSPCIVADCPTPKMRVMPTNARLRRQSS